MLLWPYGKSLCSSLINNPLALGFESLDFMFSSWEGLDPELSSAECLSNDGINSRWCHTLIFKYWSHKKKPYGLCASVSELWYTGVWKCRVTNHDPHSCYLFLGKSGTYWLGQILLQFSLTRLLPRQTLVNPYMLSTKLQKLVGLDFWALLSMNSVPCHCTGRSRSYFNNHL